LIVKLKQTFYIMGRKEEILQDNVYVVGGKLKENLDAPNGVVYSMDIEAIRDEFFNFTSGYLASELVDVKKNYPEKDTMDIEFKTDFVVMRREHFDELIALDMEVKVDDNG